MITEIRKLTGLSHGKLGALLGVSKSMIQFAEKGKRGLGGHASKKMVWLAVTMLQLKAASRKKTAGPVAFTNAAAFAKQHKKKTDHHSDQARKLQRQLDLLMQQHARLGSGLALLDAMKNSDTELYSSTKADKHMAGLLEFFNRDKMEQLHKKMELLQNRIAVHRGYAAVHKKQWQLFEAMKK